ncbi:U11/U12 small nuclear ribonucleoprotein 48 kDa protein [Aethina tumida]|uniref:U11/U12 small nuclear ribonucleoprotein 48 kDa protein n=1 Tax=Aethina tumida TaxID=116153 RepID=UPI00096B22BA|nr:U11/U12 small nuclear ribonucleoprotein 48 kDa protein [Aethina tumida]
MSININERLAELKEFDQAAAAADSEIESITKSLGWSVDLLRRERPTTKCPYNPQHTISKNVDEHIQKCRLKALGYNPEEEFLSEPSTSKYSMKIDHATKVLILGAAKMAQPDFRAAWDGKDDTPMTSGRLTSTFSADERLALHNYVVQNSEKPPVPEDLPLFSEPTSKEREHLSVQQLMALKRDAKRRRVKYKAVHTQKKSVTEVLREVVNNQMELLEDYLSSRDKIKRYQNDDQRSDNNSVEHERSGSSISRHSTHSGGSKHRRPEHDYRDRRNDYYHRRYSDYRHKGRRYDHRDYDRHYDSEYKDKRNRHYKEDKRYDHEQKEKRYDHAKEDVERHGELASTVRANYHSKLEDDLSNGGERKRNESSREDKRDQNNEERRRDHYYKDDGKIDKPREQKRYDDNEVRAKRHSTEGEKYYEDRRNRDYRKSNDYDRSYRKFDTPDKRKYYSDRRDVRRRSREKSDTRHKRDYYDEGSRNRDRLYRDDKKYRSDDSKRHMKE